MLSSSVFLVRKEREFDPKQSNKRGRKKETFPPSCTESVFIDVVVVCLLSRSRTSGSNLLLEIVFGENLGDILNGDNRPWEIPSLSSSSSSKRVVVVVRVVVNVVCVRFSSSIFCTHDVEFSPLLRIHKPPPRPLMMNNTSQRRGDDPSPQF